MSRISARRRWSVLAGIAVSAALLAVVFWHVGRIDLAAAFARLGIADFALAVAGLLAASTAVSWRFGRAAGRLVGDRVGLGEVLRTYLPIVLATGLLAHGLTVGAEVARLLFLKRRHGLGVQAGIAVLVMDRLVGVAMAAHLGLVSWILVFWPMSTPTKLTALAAFLVLGTAAAIVTLTVARMRWPVRLKSLAPIYVAYLGRPGLLVEQLATSMAATCGVSAALFVISGAIGADIPFGIALAAGPLVYVGSSVPFTYAGWGSREITCIAIFAWTGWMATVDAVLLSVLLGMAAFVATLPGLLSIRQVIAKPTARPL